MSGANKRGQVTNMTELERAVQWLEELERLHIGDSESKHFSRLHKECAANCRVLLDALREYEEDQRRSNQKIKEVSIAYGKLQANGLALLDALRWVPISDRLPTEDDADDYGKVLCLWVDDDMEAFSAKRIEEWNRIESIKITHWRALPPKPEGSE